MADVSHRAAGGGDALELALVGPAEGETEGDLVAGGDEVVDVDLEVGEGALDQFVSLLPGLVGRSPGTGSARLRPPP